MNFYLPERICSLALDAHIALPQAVEFFLDAASLSEASITSFAPKTMFLQDFLMELEAAPQNSAAIEARYREHILTFFAQWLDDFTEPQTPATPLHFQPLPPRQPPQ